MAVKSRGYLGILPSRRGNPSCRCCYCCCNSCEVVVVAAVAFTIDLAAWQRTVVLDVAENHICNCSYVMYSLTIISKSTCVSMYAYTYFNHR